MLQTRLLSKMLGLIGLLAIIIASSFSSRPAVAIPSASGAGLANVTSVTSAALNWLTTHQLSDGSYGSCSELETAPAAYALWIFNHNSASAFLSYNFLRNKIDNSTTYFWIGGGCSLAEADIPGEILYTFDASQNLNLLNLSFVGPKLLSFQEANGGFYGYFDNSQSKQVTSSVDTSMALLGLIDAASISPTAQTNAINYLLSLQNANGTFDLTNTISASSLSSMGPETISMTALAVLVLANAGFSMTNNHVSSALTYLSREAGMNFSGHVYAASLTALALTTYCTPTGATQALSFLASQQNPDGGFRDIIRSSTGSNALDTGWATVALQFGGGSNCLSATVGSGGGRRPLLT